MPTCLTHNQTYNTNEYCVYCGKPNSFNGECEHFYPSTWSGTGGRHCVKCGKPDFLLGGHFTVSTGGTTFRPDSSIVSTT